MRLLFMLKYDFTQKMIHVFLDFLVFESDVCEIFIEKFEIVLACDFD
jgi:hypothetical protein